MNPLFNAVRQIRELQDEIAKGAVIRPATDLFNHGLVAGKYQGLESALLILQEIEEQEKQLS